MAFLFAEMGVGTGVDLPALLETARRFQEILPDILLTGALSRAGLPRPGGLPLPLLRCGTPLHF